MIGTISYISGSILFILVGLLHLYVHKTRLISTYAKEKIEQSGKIKIGGKNVEIWKLWQGMSLLFGFLIALIGMMNIVSWNDLHEIKSISKTVCILNLSLLVLIIYSGFKFFGKMQVYGGVLGFILFSLALILS